MTYQNLASIWTLLVKRITLPKTHHVLLLPLIIIIIIIIMIIIMITGGTIWPSEAVTERISGISEKPRTKHVNFILVILIILILIVIFIILIILTVIICINIVIIITRSWC